MGVGDGDAFLCSHDLSEFGGLVIHWDAISNNSLVMQQWVTNWEALPESQKSSIVVMCDTCGIHMHHLAKLQLGALRPRTMRHLPPAASLHGLCGVQDQAISLLEATLPAKVRRRIGASPQGMQGNLRSFIDIASLLEGLCDRRCCR